MTPLGWSERSKTAPVHKKREGVQTKCLVDGCTGDSKNKKVVTTFFKGEFLYAHFPSQKSLCCINAILHGNGKCPIDFQRETEGITDCATCKAHPQKSYHFFCIAEDKRSLFLRGCCVLRINQKPIKCHLALIWSKNNMEDVRLLSSVAHFMEK